MTQKGFIKLTKQALTTYLIISTLFIGTGLIYLFGPWTGSAEAVWFNDDWGYRQELPVTSTNGSAQSNVFLSFTLDTSTLITAGKLQSSCQDIRITDINGNILPYRVGRTNACNASNTTIDFLLRSFPDLKSTYYVYYGNPSVASKDVGANFSESQASNYSVGTLGTEAKAESPTLYWKYDDGTGTTAQDSAISNLDGTLNNTPTWQTEDQCISSKCLYFSGTANMNVSKSDDAKLDFAATDNFTVTSWVKRNGASSAINYIISKADTTTGGYKLWMDADGDLCFGIDDDSSWGPDISTCSTNANFDDDKWHYAVGVRSNTDDKVYIYIDGKQYDSQTDPTTGTLANTNIFYSGVDRDGTSNEWLGFIDEVKVYNYQRSSAQVQADFAARGNNEGVAVRFGVDPNNPFGALNDGMVGYWKMDESSTGAGAVSRVDSSGNGTTLTDTNTTASGVGKFSNGSDFELGNTEYLSAADNAPLSITGSLTLAAWINPETVSAGSYNIIAKWDGANESYRLFQNGDEIRIELDSAGNYVETTASNLAAGTWYHVVGVYNSNNATARVYINGALATTTTTGTIPSSIGDDAGKIHIGAEDSTGGATGYYDGIVEEARVFSRVLSNNEVVQLYNFAPGPVGYWKMEENAGLTAYDSSSNANTGTLTAGTTWAPGKFGSAMLADVDDEEIDAGSGTSLDDLPASGMTIAGWINPTTLKSGGFSYREIITKNTNNNPQDGWSLDGQESSGKIRFYADCNTGYVELDSTSSALTLNTWQHFEVTWDGSCTASGHIHLYVNGILVDGTATDGSAGRVSDASTSLVIGGVGAGGSAAEGFRGSIDDVRIYNYIRTQGQVIEDMNAGHPAPGSPVGTPLGYWKFDEGVDNTCSGGTNDTCNSGNQGSSLDGAESNMAIPATSTSGWTQSGKFRKGLIFDASNDVVNAGSNVAIDDLTDNPVSFSAWIYPNTVGEGNQGVIMAKNSGATPSSGWLWQLVATNTLKFSVDGSTDLVVTASNSKINLGAWNHVALVWDGVFTTASSVHMYVNGVEVTYQTQTNGATIVSDAASSLYIGNDSSGASTFDGTIDEVKVYAQALTLPQILTDMNGGQSQVMGALSDKSTYQPQAANQEYCVPGDSTSCAAPVLEWKLEEGNGTSTYDSSTQGNVGVLTSGPVWTLGKIGKAISFDGSDDVVTDTSAASSLTGLTTISMSAWINPSGWGGNNFGRIIQLEDSGGTSKYNMTVDNDGVGQDMTIRMNARWNAGSTDATWTGPANALSLNSWYHVAFTYDGSSGSNDPVFYVNGKKVATYDVTAPTSTIATVVDRALIGNNSAVNRGFAGIIDHARVYNYILTDAQVAWDYNRGGPIGHWKMDECQGTTINDSSGNSNTGTWSGAGGSQTTAGTCTTASTAWGNGVTGKRNYSLNFDGTDDYVSVTDPGASSIFDFDTGQSITLSAWIKPSVLSGNQTILAKGRTNNDDDANYVIRTGNNGGEEKRLVFYYRNAADNGYNIYRTDSDVFTAGSWHHVVVTYTYGTAATLKAYVNGVLYSGAWTSGTGSEAPALNNDPLLFGKISDGGTTEIFPGQIDDVRIYNYALTAVQVKALYNDGSTRFGPSTGAP